ncbi:MAG: sigma-70 family RNA polymerase sigma factor [Sedimentisphaerales bacterium]|nr:sigma-70 family RNA polymerase sigma factor [Sedimentisphaerales bacterium]
MAEFVRLLTANQSQIYAYIMSLVGNCADADDVLQETTATMWEKFGEFKPGTDFISWGGAIAYYKVREFRRKHRGKFHFDDDVLDILSRDARHELRDSNTYLSKLHDCMKKLKPSDYQLVRLRYFSGVSINELSQRFNKTARTVYYQIAKIHGLLMRCIERSVSSEERV